MLRATTASTLSTSQLPKVLRDRLFLTLFSSKCASRRHGVQVYICPCRCLRTRRFGEPTFRPSGATVEITQCFATFLHLRAPASSLPDFLHLLSSHFSLSPCLSFFLAVLLHSVHIVGSLASKLPSIMGVVLATTIGLAPPKQCCTSPEDS